MSARPSGPLTKVTVLDDTRGWIVEQHLYDAANRHAGFGLCHRFSVRSESRVFRCRGRFKSRLPPAELSFTLKTEQHLLNQLAWRSHTALDDAPDERLPVRQFGMPASRATGSDVCYQPWRRGPETAR